MPYKDPDKRRASGRVAMRRWRAAHPDEVRGWRAAHLEKRRVYERAYYLAHRERLLKTSTDWNAANHDRKRAAEREWARNNPDVGRVKNRRWRARKAGNGGSHTAREWRAKLELFAGCCIYCGEEKKLEADHKIPLARGGTDDIENIVPACRGCNSSKGTRTTAEFIALRLSA